MEYRDYDLPFSELDKWKRDNFKFPKKAREILRELINQVDQEVEKILEEIRNERS